MGMDFHFQELTADIMRGLIRRVVVYKLEPATLQGIRTKITVPDPATANIARLMASFRYFLTN